MPVGAGDRSRKQGPQAAAAGLLQLRAHPSDIAGHSKHCASPEYMRVRGSLGAFPVELLSTAESHEQHSPHGRTGT